jgi:hypothetical protein
MSEASSEVVAIEFETPAGETLSFEWHADALAAIDAQAPPDESVWRLGGELDWDEVQRLRVLSARLGDGRLLGLAAILPAGAGGHGEELLAAVIGGDSAFEQLDEALLSTERVADGAPRRVGLELYPQGAEIALRIAGDAVGVTSSEQGGLQRTSVALALRSAAGEGAGLLDLVAPR